MFAELLVNNREKLKESESFVLTLQKDKSVKNISNRRINLRKILSLDEIINKPYERVTIELKENYDIDEIKKLLTRDGKTKISLIINNSKKENPL